MLSEIETLSDSELYALIKPLISRQKKFINWALSFSVRPRAIFSPTTQIDVQRLVEYARRNKYELRAFGCGHSPSDLVCTQDILVQLDGLNRILNVDKEKQTMTVEAGMRLGALVEHAKEYGLALSNLGSIVAQSLGGSIATATHGCGLKHGNLSSHVLEATLVLADTSVVTCSREQNPDLFYASMCGLGSTGVFTSLKIQLEPFYHLQDEHFTLSLDDFLDNIDEGDGSNGIFAAADHIRAYWVPQIGKVKVSKLDHVPLNYPLRPVGATLYERWVPNWLVGTHIHQASLLLAKHVRSFIFWYAPFSWHFGFSNNPHPFLSLFKTVPRKPHPRFPSSDNHMAFVDSYDKLFTYDCGPRQYTFECAVPMPRVKETMHALREWMATEASDPEGLRHHFPVEIRPTEADEIWLSPSYKQRVCYIGVCQYKPYGFDVPWERFFERFEDICCAHGGRPHWAKAHHASPTQLAAMYPRFKDFVQLRDKVDPQGVFLNPYTKRHLKGMIGSLYDFGRFFEK